MSSSTSMRCAVIQGMLVVNVIVCDPSTASVPDCIVVPSETAEIGDSYIDQQFVPQVPPPQTMRFPGKYVGLVDAFYEAAHASCPFATIVDVEMADGDLIVQVDPPMSSQDNQATIEAFVANYVDPPFYLSLLSSENMPLSSTPINTTSMGFLQAFMAQLTSSGTMQHIKTIVRCTTDNLPYFATWDSNADPITATVSVVDWQTDAVVSSATIDLSDIIAQRWVPLATSPDQPAAVAALSNMQLNGPCACKAITLTDIAPTDAAIWHLRGFVSNSNAHISVNGLQRMTYNVEYPIVQQ